MAVFHKNIFGWGETKPPKGGTIHEKANFFCKKVVTGFRFRCFRNTVAYVLRRRKTEKPGRDKTDSKHGKTGNTCGKTKLFHILHRFLHRGKRLWKEAARKLLVYIINYDNLRQITHFFTCCVFHNTGFWGQKLGLDRRRFSENSEKPEHPNRK